MLSAPRAIRILVLEHIPDAKDLRDVDARLLTAPSIRSLIQTADSFTALEVTQSGKHSLLFGNKSHESGCYRLV